MKKILILFFCVFSQISISTIPLLAEQKQQQQAHVHCCKELEPLFLDLKQIPEVNELLEKILERGRLKIQFNKSLSKKFDGYWSPVDRTIYITKSRSAARMMTTILFEMHNAVDDAELEELDYLAMHRKLTKKKYIEAVERWEYKHARATASIINKGIHLGLLSRECYWPVSDTFEEHLAIQKSCGHSAHIGKMYDSILH